MADYRINLGINLDNQGLQNIRNQINSLERNPINIQLNDRPILNQISNIRQQLQQLGNIRLNLGGNGGGGNNNFNNINRNMSQIRLTVNNTDDAIDGLRRTMGSLNFNNGSIDLVTRNLQEMNLAITRVQHTMSGNTLRLNVTGIDEANRTVNIIRELNTETDQITEVSRRVSQSFGRTREETRQINAAYREMKSIIKEIGSVTIDINNAREAGVAYDSLSEKLYVLQGRYQTLEATFATGFDNNQTRNLRVEWENLGHSVNIANERMANTSAQQRQRQANAELRKSYQDLLSMANQISSVKTKIGELEIAGGHSNEIEALENRLESLRATYESLINSFINSGGLTSGIFDVGDFDRLNNAINQSGINISELKAKLADGIKVKINTDVANDLSKVHSDFDRLSNKSTDLKQKLDLLDSIKIDLDTAAANNDIDGLVKAYTRYERALKDVKIQLDINKRAEQDSFNDSKLKTGKENALLRLKNLFDDNSQAAKKFATEVDKLKKEIRECGNDRSLTKINKDITNLGLRVKEADVQTQTIGTKLKNQFAKHAEYFSVASLFMYATQAAKSMFEQVKLIDSAMTELKKVTDETDDTYNKFLTNAASRASEIGTTIDGLIQSTSDFARLGYNFADAQGLAEVANIYAVVGDEIEGVEEATESLISTMAAFKDEAQGVSNTDFATGIIDKFNEIGNKFAISSGGIGEAMKRSASSLDAANNSIDESIALITAANTVVGFVPRNIVICLLVDNYISQRVRLHQRLRKD